MAAGSHHESKNIKEEKANVVCAVWPFPSDYCVLRAYWVRLVWLYSLHPTKKKKKNIPVGGSHNRWQSSPVLCRHNTLYEKSQTAQTTFAFFLLDMLTLWVTLSSVGIAFRGDYVGLRRSQQWRDVLTRNSLHKMDRYVVFADIVNKINRSNGKVRLLPRHAACAAPD